MDNLLTLVLDLNLIVSGLIGKPATRALLDHWRDQRFVLVLSSQLVEELLAVLGRPKFKKYFTGEDVQELSNLLREHVQMVEPTIELTICRDPKDNILLEVAATASADFVVTGDKDLLDDPFLVRRMKQVYDVDIVTASELLRILEEQK